MAAKTAPAGAAGISGTDAAATPPAKPGVKVLEDKTLTNEEVKQLLAQNYRPMSRGGQIYYCRSEQRLGSRFATMTCRTAGQMKDVARESKDLTAAKQKSSGCAAQKTSC
ncbi:MAG: hypothetical protein JOY91_04935 [Sinobacteraceae bacterium]|nr:hypothetical protein [Nevskiaceae bacterium]